MSPFELERMLTNELPLSFLLEVICRAGFAFAAVFLFLKASGRRGIKQLSRFELVVILTLGSAAGDVTFYEDVPLLPVAVVFLSLLVLYRFTVYVMTRSRGFEAWIDGLPVTVVKDGMYVLESLGKLNISSNELFMELRQQGVEHLGQVRIAILETDGDVSVFYYDNDSVRPGLSVMPYDHQSHYTVVPASALYCCVACGFPEPIDQDQEATCPRCKQTLWSPALATKRCR